MFGKKPPAPAGPTEYERLQTHISYLRQLAERLDQVDGEAVRAAAGMLEEFGAYLHKAGALK